MSCSAAMLAVARDELMEPTRSTPSIRNGTTSGCTSGRMSTGSGIHPFAQSDGAAGDGPLSTLRRSLRQMNPFRSRLFRLPATPRLSRSKKVLGRGEESTGWNFVERPSSSTSNSLRQPFSGSFGSADVHEGRMPPFQRRRLSQMVEHNMMPPQASPSMFPRRRQSRVVEECNCCGARGPTAEALEGLDDLDEFLNAMEHIARRSDMPIGGSCRVVRPQAELPGAMGSDHLCPEGMLRYGNGGRPMVSGTVACAGGTAGGMLPGPGTRRFRPPIPSFAPPPCSGATATISGGGFPQALSSSRGQLPQSSRLPPDNGHNNYQFLPSTCYAPDGEMYAARWHPSGGQMPSQLQQSPRAFSRPPQRQSRRPVGFLLENNNNFEQHATMTPPSLHQPKSPSQCSVITLLNTASSAPLGRGARSASTSAGSSQQHHNRQLNGAGALFPQTQLQRRRSACSARGGIVEEAEDEVVAEKQSLLSTASANYYGRDVVRLMELRQQQQQEEEEEQSKKNQHDQQQQNDGSSSSSPTTLLPPLEAVFPLPEGLCLHQSTGDCVPSGATATSSDFVGREWLFRELCHQLQTERAQMILVQGASGSGKSALIRHILAHSHFGGGHKSPCCVDPQQQHNTVDSGIAIGINGGCSSGGSGGNSSGSQLSLLNLSVHPLDPIPPAPASPKPQQHAEWVGTLAKHVVAFHLANLHNALSCSVAEFVRSLCAQMCSSPQLKHSYGEMIRSEPRLHRMATDEAHSLCVEPLELFMALIARPLAKLYGEEKEQRRRGQSSSGHRKRCPSSKGSDYGSNYGSNDCPATVLPAINIASPSCSPNEESSPSAAADDDASPLPPFVLVLVDGLDEAGFHRTDGGESIGWLLRQALVGGSGECPPQLRFVCTLQSSNSQQPPGQLASVFGTLRDGEKALEARTIRLDDWQADERIARDLHSFVERRVRASPALDKWVSVQFRRQSFFGGLHHPEVPPPAGVNNNATNVSAFSSQLVAHLDGNFVGLQLALTMLAEGRALSLDNLPSGLDQLYTLHFRHRFPSSTHFQELAPLLSVLMASLHSLTLEQLLWVLNCSASDSEGPLEEHSLREMLVQLAPLVVQQGAVFVPAHPSLREWLLKECTAAGAEFPIDIRHGHILIAFSLIRRPFSSSSSSSCFRHEHFFELAHHLLKANPHKYASNELCDRVGMPSGRDAQVQWLKMAAGGGGRGEMPEALLSRRNVFYPNSKVSRLLLLAGADPNASKWPDGAEEPLLCAFIRAGNPEMVQLLLQFGADPNAGSPPPLIVAVQHDREELVRLLCAQGADPCAAQDEIGRGPLFHAAARDALGAVAFLLDALDGGGTAGKRVGGTAKVCAAGLTTTTHKNGDEGLKSDMLVAMNRRYSACSSSYEEGDTQRAMRERGQADRRQSPADRMHAIREAFEVAAERGSATVCRYLLDSTDTVLDTSRAMCIACANGRSEVVQFLLSRGATLAPEHTWNGKSALVCAVESGSWDLVVQVLNRSGPLGATDELNQMSGPDRLSPLMVAARHGHVGLVDLLVNRGAHLDAADLHGRTAAMHAIEAGHSSTVALLLERGCALHARDSHGNTMLHLLARHPNKCLINRLLEAGLPLEDKNKEDLRPLEVAIQAGKLLAVDTFLRRGARLRSLTWQCALGAHPPLVLVLLRKLLDDANILLRRKRHAEAQHRFSYALQKCDELLERVGVGEAALQALRPQLRRYKVQALHSMAALKRRCNDLKEAIALASCALELLDDNDVGGGRRRPHKMPTGHKHRPRHASSCSTSSSEDEGEDGGVVPVGQHGVDEGEEEQRVIAEEQRFELHLLRAKCHFDARDVQLARVDAQLAACLRPAEAEAQNLLAVLSMGT